MLNSGKCAPLNSYHCHQAGCVPPGAPAQEGQQAETLPQTQTQPQPTIAPVPTPTAVAPAPAPSQALPNNGAWTQALGASGLALVQVGSGLIVWARRRLPGYFWMEDGHEESSTAMAGDEFACGPS